MTKKAGEDFTKITFYPNLARFKMDELDDVAGLFSEINVFLNGRQLPVSFFCLNY